MVFVLVGKEGNKIIHSNCSTSHTYIINDFEDNLVLFSLRTLIKCLKRIMSKFVKVSKLDYNIPRA